MIDFLHDHELVECSIICAICKEEIYYFKLIKGILTWGYKNSYQPSDPDFTMAKCDFKLANKNTTTVLANKCRSTLID